MERCAVVLKCMIFLSVFLAACTGNTADVMETFAGRAETGPEAETDERATGKEEGAKVENLKIRVSGNDQVAVFELNDSRAARSLYEQLPLTVQVENYGGNEKIFYPPQKLETEDTHLTDGGEAGGLAYFAPWNDVVMYYGSFGPYSGLYELGAAVSGSEVIEKLSGEILIETVE